MTDGDRDEDAIGIAPEEPDVQNGVRMPLIGSQSDITDNMEEWFRDGLTNTLARVLGPHRIRVNAIAPGTVLTERQRQLWFP